MLDVHKNGQVAMVISEVGLVLSLFTWAVILWNTRALAFRTETRSLCEKINSIDAAITEKAISLWVSTENISQAEVEQVLIQVGRLEVCLQHLADREPSFALSSQFLAEYRSALTLYIESSGDISEAERLDAANRIADQSMSLQQHIENRYLTTYVTFLKRNRMALRRWRANT